MIGQVFSGRYELVEETDVGPVYETFKAKDKLSGKECTLRLLKSEIAREPGFLPEVRAIVEEVADVTHPNLEQLQGVLSDQGQSYILSEFTPGASLEDRIKRLSSFSVPVAVGTVVEVAEAVSALHAAGIVHGDISGKTVFATSADSIKVCVPGLWRAYGNSARAAVSALRSMAPYLAPEVTAGGMPGFQSDIYAMGVLLWQLLTGRLPYPGDTPSAIAVKHATAPYPSLRQVTSSVPMPLDKIVEKAMAKEPAARYRSVEDLLRDLRLLAEALRFGKPLTWPLQPADAAHVDKVVPEMNVANPKREKSTAKRSDTSDGVPGWLQGIAYIAVGMAVLVIAAWFYFNIHKPKPLHTPNLVGKSQLEAMQDLQKMGLKLRILPRKEASEKYGEGVVVSQAPTAGEDVLEHSYVEAVVSSGSKFVTVPSLKGKTVEECRDLLKAINLDVSDQIEFVANNDYQRGFVVSQEPEAEKKVTRFSRVKLRVASGEHQDESPTSSERYTLTVAVKNVTSPVLVRVDLSDARGNRTVHEDTHSPDDTFKVSQRAYGDDVTFKVYYDNVLVKTVRPPKPKERGPKPEDTAGVAEDAPAPAADGEQP
ncbi:MAG: protein kinase [Armatimonadetes bacterium]|nr:protein kinase [Armatimonadota bacterium]